MPFLFPFALLTLLYFASIPLKGQEWRCLGPFENTIPMVDSGKMTPHGVGRLHALALLDKKGKKIVVSSSTGGSFYTQNYGKTWTPNYHYPLMTGANRILAWNKKTYWLATCSNHLPHKPWGLGVLEAQKKGKVWKATGLEKYPSEYDQCCLFDLQRKPNKKNIVYALSPQMLYKTTDKGNTWSTILEDEQAVLRRMAVSAHHPKTIILSGKKVYISHNDGETFEDITPSLLDVMPQKYCQRFNVTFFGQRHTQLFALALGHQPCLLQSSDMGKSWTLTNKNAGLFSEHELGIWAFNTQGREHLLLGGIRAFLSSDSGKTTQQITFPFLSPNYVHDDIRDAHITAKGHLYLAHDGGISKSTDLGKTWTNLNGKGLCITQFYGMSNSEIEPDKFYAGTLDMSTKMYEHNQWYCLSHLYSDGGKARMSPTDTQNVYISKSGYAYQLDSHSRKWRYAHPFSKRADFDFPMSFDAHGHDFYMVNDHLWKRQGHNGVWVRLTEGLPAERDISCFSLSPQNPSTIWFARKEQTWSSEKLQHKLYVTEDSGQHWTDMTPYLPILAWKHIRYLYVTPENDSQLYVGLGDFDPPHTPLFHAVYRSDDKGLHWVNISKGLPNFPVHCIISHASTLWAATDVGVFVKQEGEEEWKRYGNGLPPVVCTELHINHAKKVLRVTTFGRGIWEASIQPQNP
jgi:photosystem II stability/assembly factor-like uncharacterized protein